MNCQVMGLLEILRLNTQLFKRCMDGLSDETARMRPNPESYSAAFLAAHLVDSRHCLARMLGEEKPNRLHDARQTVATVVERQNEPPLAEIIRAWQEVSRSLGRRLTSLTAADLKSPSAERFPVEDGSLFGSIVFLLHHESYHIGQLALVRKYFGVGAVRYGHRAFLSEM